MTTTKDWKYWLRTLGYPQKERAPRRNPRGLAAMHGSLSSPKLGRVKIISRTGLYLQTAERWPIGEVVSLTLQKDTAAAADSAMQIDVQARVASYGEDGVGLGFILPAGLDAGLWEQVVDIADTPDETADTQIIFKMVRAMLFVYRLCPSTATEPMHIITGELDESRTRNMLTIALTAEKMLADEPEADKLHAHPHMVASILKNGSWEQDDLTQQLWAGLLVSSCNEDGSDDSNQEFAELMVQVTTNQAHILVEGCRRAIEQLAGKQARPKPVIFSPEEMISINGIYDFYRNATDVAYLYGYGLVANNFDFSTHGVKTNFDITPTELGMQLFKVCRGHLLAAAPVLS